MFGRCLYASCLLALVVACTSCSRGPTRDELLRRGDRLMASQQYAQAARAYRAIVLEHWRDGEARWKLAEAYVRAGNWSAANAEAIRAAELLPDHLDINLLAATTMLTQQQRFLDVAHRMSALLRTHPDEVRLLVMWGNATAHLRDSNWALFSLNSVIGNESLYESARRDIRPLTSSSQDAEAERAFRKAIELDPADVESQSWRWPMDYGRPVGRTMRNPSFEQWLTKSPGHGLANEALGRFYLARGRDGDGERYLLDRGQCDRRMRPQRSIRARRLLHPIAATPACARAVEIDDRRTTTETAK